ncbi:MAG: glycosyltransferase [Acidobacteriota bacterium]
MTSSPAPGRARISLVIPAYNEEALLPRLLDSVDVAARTWVARGGTLEVVVADNASTDDTAQIASVRGCRVVRVERRRIASARNGGAAAADGEVLAFVDADSRIHPDTLVAVDRAMRDPRVIAGATGVRLERRSPGIVATWLLLIPLVILLRMDTGVVFCRREDFDAVGGYDERRAFGEDVQFLWDLRRRGRTRGQRLVRLRGTKALASTRKFDRHGDWHYFTSLLRLAPLIVRDPSATTEFAERYWYDDDR